MMIEAYYDESGIHDGAEICVVGGFYGTQAAWRKFELQWNKILQDHELGNIGFHAKDFWGRDKGKRVPPYSQWNDAKADKFLDRLIQAVMRNRIFPVGHGVLVSDWDALELDTRKWFTGAKYRFGKFLTHGCPKKCYYLPFQFCVLDSARNSGTTDKIHFFAGLDRTFSGYAKLIYEQMTVDQRLPPRVCHQLGQISFPLSKHTPGIQAADMLVYQLYQLNKSRLIGNAKISPVLNKLIHNRKNRQNFMLLMTKQFREIIEVAKHQYAHEMQNVPKLKA